MEETQDRDSLLTRQAIQPDLSITTPPPAFPITPFQAFGTACAESVPLLDERSHVTLDVWLEFVDTFLRKDVGDDFAFTRVCSTVPGIKEATGDGDECIVEMGL